MQKQPKKNPMMNKKKNRRDMVKEILKEELINPSRMLKENFSYLDKALNESVMDWIQTGVGIGAGILNFVPGLNLVGSALSGANALTYALRGQAGPAAIEAAIAAAGLIPGAGGAAKAAQLAGKGAQVARGMGAATKIARAADAAAEGGRLVRSGWNVGKQAQRAAQGFSVPGEWAGSVRATTDALKNRAAAQTALGLEKAAEAERLAAGISPVTKAVGAVQTGIGNALERGAAGLGRYDAAFKAGGGVGTQLARAGKGVARGTASSVGYLGRKAGGLVPTAVGLAAYNAMMGGGGGGGQPAPIDVGGGISSMTTGSSLYQGNPQRGVHFVPAY